MADRSFRPARSLRCRRRAAHEKAPAPPALARVLPFSARFQLRLERTGDPVYAAPLDCSDPRDVAHFLHRLLADEPYEVLGALLLDAHRRAIGHILPFRGSLDRTLCSPGGIFGSALLANASAVILFHNHPSGTPQPSDRDLETTRRMAQAGEILGVSLYDHVILGERPLYYSLRAAGQLDAAPGSLAALVAARRRRDHRRRVKPKYHDPETGETWAGRGTMATWLRRKLEAGARLEDFRVVPGDDG